MDAKLGDLVPVTGTAEDERTGLAILQLLAEAADSPPQSRWVHRRVAQLEFLDTRAVRWRISVDFSTPESGPSLDGRQHLLVPITRWRKSELVKLDFRDEQGTAIPLMTAEATSCLMSAALYRWAADILRREKVPEPGTMFGELSEIVSQPPDPAQQEKTADAKSKSCWTRRATATRTAAHRSAPCTRTSNSRTSPPDRRRGSARLHHRPDGQRASGHRGSRCRGRSTRPVTSLTGGRPPRSQPGRGDR